MKRKYVVCLVTLITLFALSASVLVADEAKEKKTVLETASDTSACIMAGQIVEKGVTAYTKSNALGKAANAATVGACTAILDNKDKIANTAKKIINKVSEAVGKFGEREAQKDKANPYRNKL